MRLLAVLVAFLPFVILELGLRQFNDADLQGVDQDPYVGLHQLRPLFALNAENNRWEIPPQRYNFFRPESFPATKPPDTRRIFVLGGSTVQGRPYATETAFSTWLRLRLESADMDTNFEVINCGGVSYASYRVAKILDEVLLRDPDAVVLYTGHNEFLEDRTYAHVRDMGVAARWATAVGSKLHTVRWLQSFAKGKSDHKDLPTTLSTEVNAKLDHPGGLDSYQRDPAWRLGVEEHFRAKLQQMVRTTKQHNIPMILCVPASDLVNTPPIKITKRNDWSKSEQVDFDAAWSIASDAESKADKRINAARECLNIDAEHAGANYVLGRLLFDHGDSESARKHLIAARDADVCPLRAPTSIVETTRLVAEQNNVLLIDTPKLLDERNVQGDPVPDQISDPNRFVDHLHPSIAGHQKIAAALTGQFQDLGWIKLDQESEKRYEIESQRHMRELGEAYFVRGKQRLEGLRLWASGRAGQLATDVVGDDHEAPSGAIQSVQNKE